MKISNKLIVENGTSSLKELTYLNLSDFNIALIENLDQCSNLRHLIMRNNELDCLLGLEKCRQLWRLEVNNNRIRNLEGLSKFVALGSLNLHSNDLNWVEFEKIRHLHVIDLVTSNNPKLDKDPQYRIHLVDCLPNVWMIDGLLVTSVERQEVANFYEESAKSQKPVRRKLPKYQFIPSDQKTRDIFGDWSTKLLSKFAVNENKNIETDIRRLEFLANWFEDIIINDFNHAQNKLTIKKTFALNKTFLRHLIEFRKVHTEMCNMILVLLVASLEFKIPINFLNETLLYTNLNKISDSFDTIKLFELPRVSRIYIANLLLSAVKIDRDQNMETGFYENLFLSIRNLLNELYRQANQLQDPILKDFNDLNHDYDDFNNHLSNLNRSTLKDNKSLLSTEIIQLFCIVPSFYDHLSQSEGLIKILNLSIGETRMYFAIETLLEDARRLNKSPIQISEELGSFITNLLKLNARQLLNKKSKRQRINQKTMLTPNQTSETQGLDIQGTQAQIIQNNIMHPRSANRSASITKTNSLLVNNPSLNYKSPRVKESLRSNSPLGSILNDDSNRLPLIDDSVLIDHKQIGKITKIHKENIVQVKFDDSIDLIDLIEFTNQEENSLLINLKYLEWFSSKNLWKPINSPPDLDKIELNKEEIKKYLIKFQEKTPQTVKINSLINLNIFNQVEHGQSDHEDYQILKNNSDSQRSILTVNLDNQSLEKEKPNLTPRTNVSTTTITTKPSGKTVQFKLDIENTPKTTPMSSNRNIQVKTLPLIQPSLNQPQSPGTTKNFPGNKLISISKTSNSSNNNTKKSELHNRPKTARQKTNEFVQKWNTDDENCLINSERAINDFKEKKEDNFNEQIQPEVQHQNISIDHLNDINNLLVNSFDFSNQQEHDNSNHMNHKNGTTTCIHCECNKNSNMNGNSSRPSSPAIPKGPTSSTITIVHPTINNLNILNIPNKLTINNFYYQTYINPSNNTAKKQLIKLQDCTTWLTVTNNNANANNNNSNINNGQKFFSTNKFKLTSSTSSINRAEMLEKALPHYLTGAKINDSNLSKISLLLNRKINRANTNPKTPLLTSPSSKNHLLYKGLRPNSCGKNFNLISKKIETTSYNTNLIKN